MKRSAVPTTVGWRPASEVTVLARATSLRISVRRLVCVTSACAPEDALEVSRCKCGHGHGAVVGTVTLRLLLEDEGGIVLGSNGRAGVPPSPRKRPEQTTSAPFRKVSESARTLSEV